VEAFAAARAVEAGETVGMKAGDAVVKKEV